MEIGGYNPKFDFQTDLSYGHEGDVVVVCSSVVVVCIEPTPLKPSSYCRFQPPLVRQALGSPQQIPALSR